VKLSFPSSCCFHVLLFLSLCLGVFDAKVAEIVNMAPYHSLCFLLLLFANAVLAQQTVQSGPQIDITNATARVALLWTSIGVAVLTSLLQGLITTIVQIAEDQGLWTYRYILAAFPALRWG
jgi:hypothetical protein